MRIDSLVLGLVPGQCILSCSLPLLGFCPFGHAVLLPSTPRIIFQSNVPPFLRLHLLTFKLGFYVCFRRFLPSISSKHVHGDQFHSTKTLHTPTSVKRKRHGHNYCRRHFDHHMATLRRRWSSVFISLFRFSPSLVVLLSTIMFVVTRSFKV